MEISEDKEDSSYIKKEMVLELSKEEFDKMRDIFPPDIITALERKEKVLFSVSSLGSNYITYKLEVGE